MITEIGIGILTGIVAYVYSMILCDNDMVLAPVKMYASMWAQSKPWMEWVLKPVILCPVCVSGQMGLWGLLYYMLRYAEYDFIAHIVGISISILITHTLIKKL